MTKPVILWFRRDLRLADNAALKQAIDSGRPVICLYVLDQTGSIRPMGAASLWWLDGSLRALADDIAARGGRLTLRSGDSEAALRAVVEETGADRVLANRLPEADAVARDADIAHALAADDVRFETVGGMMLSEPGEVCTPDGRPYKVFSPFKKALLAKAGPPEPIAAPERMEGPDVASEPLDDWALKPTRPDWATDFDWRPGETAALAALDLFVDDAAADYSIGRDQPGRRGGSRLSPHLHWGELHPWRVVSAVRAAVDDGRIPEEQGDKFVSELAWRDFSSQLVRHFPAMVERNHRREFDDLQWRDAPDDLAAWKAGRTGYPIVDAGMRQLWTSGWMHNRVRMIAASFLVKHLLIDWREGEAWFWDCLVDADLGNNVQNWQWIAGTGADASPFFRIFNPIIQGEKFDGDGLYVRRWVPELAALSDKWLHQPWAAPEGVMTDAGVVLGRDYPEPIVDHAEARERALAAFREAVRKD